MTGDLEDNIRKWLKDTIIDVVRDALPELKELLIPITRLGPK